MANNWAGSDFINVWNFDTSPGLLIPSVGTGTLTNINTVSQSATAKQGDRSASIVALTNKKLYIPDASLMSTFPGQSSGSNYDFTITGWFNFSLFHASAAEYLYGKWLGAYVLRITTGLISLHINDGSTTYSSSDLYQLVINRWYHIAWTFNNTTKGWVLRIWDDTAGSIVLNTSGNSTVNINTNSTGLFGVGYYSSWVITGLIDELAVAPSVHDSTDIDAIRSGTFEYMPNYKISGYLQDPSAKLIVLSESDWEVEKTQDVTLGNYEIVDLVSGTKTIAAVSPDGEVVGFGGVDPIEV